MRLAKLALFVCVAPASAAAAEERAPTVSVVGEAEAQVKPDAATLSLSTNVQRPTAEAAEDESARIANVAIDGFKSAGVAAQDIQTTSLTLFPEFARNANGVDAISGYAAAENFTVRVRALEKAGTLAAAAVEKGALLSGAIQFDVSDRAARQDALRSAAVENARHRAELYAKGAGMRLGTLLAVSAGGAAPAPSARTFARSVAASTAPPIESGEITLRESVEATYTLVAP